MSHAAEVLKKINEERDGVFCDLTLVSGQLRLGVHKIIVCAQRQIIRTACTGQYKEASGVFEVKEWPAQLVKRMVDYMYTGNYGDWPADTKEQADTEKEDQPCFSHPMVFHATMASLADMYMISGLHKLAELRFESAVRQINDIRRLLDFVPAIYALEADSCKAFRKTIILQFRWLAAQTSKVDEATTVMRAAMATTPEFAIDFATSLYREPLLGHRSACGGGKIVPVNPLQCRCERCYKGGALTLTESTITR